MQRCANIFPDVFFCVCRAAFDAGCAIQPREEWGILLQECARGPHGCSIHCPGEIHGRSTASKSASFHEALPFFAAHANHNCHQMKRCPKPQKDDDVLYVYVYKYHQRGRVRRGTTVDCSTHSLSRESRRILRRATSVSHLTNDVFRRDIISSHQRATSWRLAPLTRLCACGTLKGATCRHWRDTASMSRPFRGPPTQSSLQVGIFTHAHTCVCAPV